MRLQRETLESQQDKIRRAIALIEVAQCHIDEGRDLSLDDLAILTKETVVQQSTDKTKFAARFEALIAEQDPTGQASRAFDEIRKGVQAISDAHKAELKTMVAEAGQLKEAGDVDSEAAKAFVRRLRSGAAGIRRPSQAEQELMFNAYAKTVAEAPARSELLPPDPAVIEFFRQVARGKERGELD